MLELFKVAENEFGDRLNILFQFKDMEINGEQYQFLEEKLNKYNINIDGKYVIKTPKLEFGEHPQVLLIAVEADIFTLQTMDDFKISKTKVYNEMDKFPVFCENLKLSI